MQKSIIASILWVILFMLAPVNLIASDIGIDFFHGSYKEAIEKAKDENKIVFIDFITEWCGPCRIMDRDVFSKKEVGEIFNQSFVSIKLDAESDMYMPLAKEFKVKSYPTYIFVDPNTKQIVHRSGSRQSVHDFLLTGLQASSTEYNSVKLLERYDRGDRSREFLEQYVLYLKINNYSKKLSVGFEEYMALPGVDLTDKTAWIVFSKKNRGIDNELFQEVVKNQKKYRSLFGDELNEKLESEFGLILQRAAHACLYDASKDNSQKYKDAVKLVGEYNFQNKEFVMDHAHAIYLIGQRKFDEMHELIMGILADDSYSFDQKNKFSWFANYARKVDNDIDYLNKLVIYMRYFAYNADDKTDVRAHYNYAKLLEEILLQSDIEKDIFFTKMPSFGDKTYSLRPKDLKRKPKK
ncbi:MAG: thioredoxin family protein [Bacteroidales bacterium]|nr:thioredoxin family protein [Bacteroidales bacterium]